ncbi:MAG: hypothetical protein ACOWWO_01480 [Peptococcaceae bacterium]
MAAQRILTLGGLVLIIFGVIFGFIDLLFLERSYFNARLAGLQQALEYLNKGQESQALSYIYQFEKINHTLYKLTAANFHFFIYGMLAILLAYLLPQIPFNQKLTLFLAIIMPAGGLLFTLGTILQAYGSGIGFYFTLLGGSWVFIALSSFFSGYYLRKYSL